MAGKDGNRGYLVQTIMALLESLQSSDWDRISLEPAHESEKIDILIEGPTQKKVIQVKSSINQIGQRDIQNWAEELERHSEADFYELILVGQCVPPYNRGAAVGRVSVPAPKTLDFAGMLREASHLLDCFLHSEQLRSKSPQHRELLAAALVTQFSIFSSTAQPFERAEFVRLLRNWLLTSDDPPDRVPKIPALSPNPRSCRANYGAGLIGRDEQMNWLSRTDGDRLITGQPGMGKTFLLQQLAKSTPALFLTTTDEKSIAEDLNTQRPKAVLIEDASLYVDSILFLLAHRRDMGLSFDIIADCWPGDIDELMSVMGISKSRVLQLSQVTESDIVAIANASGIRGPNQLLHLIVHQADGCPGRALMLIDACLQNRREDWNDVLTGEKLAQWVRSRLPVLIGDSATEVLACFSLGGGTGLSMESVAAILERPMPEIRRIVRGLALGGVIFDPQTGPLIAVPRAIRGILVRDIFFNSPAAIRLRMATDIIGVFPDLVETIIAAHALGAGISSHDLLRLVQTVDSKPVWALFAATSSDHADWILHHRRDLVSELSQELIESSPLAAIPQLIEMVPHDTRPEHSAPDHPARRIRDWVESGLPSQEAIKRRHIVLNAFKSYLAQGSDVNIAMILIPIILSPKFSNSEQVAGDRSKYRTWSGGVSTEDLCEIQSFWDIIFATVDFPRVQNWRPLLTAIHHWVYPYFGMNGPSAEQSAIMGAAAEPIIRRAIAAAKGRPGVLSSLRDMCLQSNIPIEAEVNATFAVLFPGRPSDDLESEFIRLSNIAEGTGKDFAEKDPFTTIRLIQWCINEAAQMSDPWPDFSTTVIGSIAKENLEIVPWINAVIDLQARADLLTPLLATSLQRHESGADDLLAATLTNEHFRFEAIRVALVCDVPEILRQHAIMECHHALDLVRHLTMVNELPACTIRDLLTHESQNVKAKALEGLWHGREKHPLPKGLESIWRDSAVNFLNDEWCLQQALKEDSQFRRDWLIAQCQNTKSTSAYHCSKMFQTAVADLTSLDRAGLLEKIQPNSRFASKLIRAVVGDSPDIFRILLSDERLKTYHRVPLKRSPDSIWFNFVTIAVEKGMAIEFIMSSSRAFFTERFNEVPDRFHTEIELWKSLISHISLHVVQVAKSALKQVEGELEFWKNSDQRKRLR